MNKVKEFIDLYKFQSQNEYKEITNNKLKDYEIPINNTNNRTFNEKNIYKLSAQQSSNRTGEYKGASFSQEKQKWKAELKINYKTTFLGYYPTELEAAKAYNDYATFINNTENTDYSLNDISDYVPIPRDIPNINKELQNTSKTSSYNGVTFDSNRNYFVAAIKYQNKNYYLGNNIDQIECAKLYNQQALYFNNEFNSDYQLNDIPDYITIPKNLVDELQNNKLSRKSSKYYGATFDKKKNKWRSVIVFNKKQLHLGFYDCEIEAAKAYDKKAKELNNANNCKYKINFS